MVATVLLLYGLHWQLLFSNTQPLCWLFNHHAGLHWQLLLNHCAALMHVRCYHSKQMTVANNPDRLHMFAHVLDTTDTYTQVKVMQILNYNNGMVTSKSSVLVQTVKPLFDAFYFKKTKM